VLLSPIADTSSSGGTRSGSVAWNEGKPTAFAHPAASVHLPDGLDVVIVEGEIAGPTSRADVIAAYDTKYDWTYDLDQYGPFTTIDPSNVLAWRAAGPAGRDGFAHTGRWSYS
jgi:hypothetical protein